MAMTMAGPLLPAQRPLHRGLPTLVLDLDNTLIDGAVKRPGLDQFLEAVKRAYEVVIFTAGTQECAEKMIDDIDRGHGCIAHRLYGNSCIDFVIKPAALLGRDMRKVVVIDDKPETYKNNADNALPISFFSAAKAASDQELLKLAPFLVSISKMDDLRTAIWEWKHRKSNRPERSATATRAKNVSGGGGRNPRNS